MQLLRSYVNDSMLTNLKGGNVQQSATQSKTKPFQTQSDHLSKMVQAQSKVKECAINDNTFNQESVTNSEAMEVSVDPEMFLIDEDFITIEDDEETVSATETKIETAKLKQLKMESDLEETNQIPVSRKLSFNDIQSGSNPNLDNETHSCSTCPEVFFSQKELQNHTTSHLLSSSTGMSSSTKIIESVIEKPYKKKKAKEGKLKSKRRKIIIRINPSPSKRNVREKAKLLPKFICAICRKNLSSKRNLHQHHETHKEPNGKFKCDGEGCKKLFGKLENFVKHKEEAHEKPARRRKIVNEK